MRYYNTADVQLNKSVKEPMKLIEKCPAYDVHTLGMFDFPSNKQLVLIILR